MVKESTEVKYHLIWESADNGLINVDFIRSEEQLGDILTKPLGRVKFHELRTKIGLIDVNRKQCLPAPRRPPGSSCWLSLPAGAF